MKMKLERRWANAVLAAGWALLVIGGVRGFDAWLTFGRAQQEELERQQGRLMRMLGWLEVEERVLARREEVMGRFASKKKGNLGWEVVHGLQAAAEAQGLVITDLRPSEGKGQGKRKAFLRLDAKVEGDLPQIDRLLEVLPEELPGARLENFQMAPQHTGKIQGILRVEWTV